MEQIISPFALFSGLLPAVGDISCGIVLAFNRESRSKRVLGITMFIAGLCWGISLIMDNLYNVDGRAAVFNTWHILSDLIMWPVIRWYMILIFRPDAGFFPKYVKQFIPFFTGLVCVLMVRAIYGSPPDVYSMKEFLSMMWKYPEFILRVILLIVFVVQTAIFFARSIRELKEYQRRLKNDFSEVDNMDLRWVHWVIYIFYLFPVFNLALAFSGDIEIRMYFYIWGLLTNMVAIVIAAAHKDIYYLPDPDRSLDKQLLHPGKTALFIPPAMEVLGINRQTYSAIRGGLTRLIDEESVCTKQDLRLDDLASMLNTNKKYVSAVINDHYGTNFYTLVNRCRVNEAKTLLRDGRQIKEVWILAGFNSQRSFNMVFKQFTGVTPSEWAAKRQKE